MKEADQELHIPGTIFTRENASNIHIMVPKFELLVANCFESINRIFA